MNSDLMTEYLPQVRCTPAMKAALVRIAGNSVAPNIADHIRFALAQYIADHDPGSNAETAPLPQDEPELVK